MPLTLEPLPTGEYAAWREQVLAHRVAHPRSRGLGAATAAARAREVVDRVLPPAGPPAGTEVLAVVTSDHPPRRVGTFFLLPAGPDHVELGDLVLADPADAPELRGLLAERLRAAGVGTLGVGVLSGDPAAEAFVDHPAAELVATQMQLDLQPDLEPDLQLDPTGPAEAADGSPLVAAMSPEELAAYFADAVEGFAEELLASDASLTPERALERSREVHEQILPQGLETPGHTFLVARDPADGRRLGMTWLFLEERAGFVYDVAVEEAERGRGLGRALMKHAAERLRAAGAEVLGLNVFGHNAVARGLYDALGYRVVDQSFTLAVDRLSPR